MRTRVLVVLAVLLAVASGVLAKVPGIINYQGRMVVNGTNFDGTGWFKFALVNGADGVSFWSNDGSSADGKPADTGRGGASEQGVVFGSVGRHNSLQHDGRHPRRRFHQCRRTVTSLVQRRRHRLPATQPRPAHRRGWLRPRCGQRARWINHQRATRLKPDRQRQFHGTYAGNGAGLTNLPTSGFTWQFVTGTTQQAVAIRLRRDEQHGPSEPHTASVAERRRCCARVGTRRRWLDDRPECGAIRGVRERNRHLAVRSDLIPRGTNAPSAYWCSLAFVGGWRRAVVGVQESGQIYISRDSALLGYHARVAGPGSAWPLRPKIQTRRRGQRGRCTPRRLGHVLDAARE